MVNEDFDPSGQQRTVLNVLRDEGMANPNLIRDVTGLERQRVNDALKALVAAGWVDRRVRGLYEIVYDGEGYLEKRIEYKGERGDHL